MIHGGPTLTRSSYRLRDPDKPLQQTIPSILALLVGSGNSARFPISNHCFFRSRLSGPVLPNRICCVLGTLLWHSVSLLLWLPIHNEEKGWTECCRAKPVARQM